MIVKIICSILLCGLFHSCTCGNHHTLNIYGETLSKVYQNDNEYDVVGLNSVYVCESKYAEQNKCYSIMLDILIGNGTMTHVRIDEEDIVPLKCFLDSCVNNSGKLTYDESFVFKRNGEDLFSTFSDKIEDKLFCCYGKGRYIDMVVRFKKFRTIIADAEEMIKKKKV